MNVDTADDLYIPTYDDVLAAHERVRPYIHRTPILTSRFLNELAGAELFFKCENLQKAGAFKVRGACNAVFGLSDEKAAKGVATHSSGNHALSLSYAAGRRGIPCHVVMPRTAPQAKKDAVRGYGGIITECEPSTSSREEVFARVQAETGADFVHPYNDERVIAGQGTCSKEMIEDLGPARRRRRPDRRRRHDLRHLPDALDHRAGRRRSTPPSPSRPTTPTSRSSRARSSPTTRRRPSPTASRCRSRSAPGTSSPPTSPTS